MKWAPIFNSSILNDGYCLYRNQQAENRSFCLCMLLLSAGGFFNISLVEITALHSILKAKIRCFSSG